MSRTLRRRLPVRGLLAACLVLLTCGPDASAAPVRVKDADGLRRAAARARPGTRIELEAGECAGGLHLSGLAGTRDRPVTIAARTAGTAVIVGGTSGLHLTDPRHVVLEDLVLRGATGNGVNIDDGGSYATPARHVLLRRLVVRDVGPRGNRDGIKLSGADDVRVEQCTVERWGDGGSALDLVGCHRVTIVGCTFRHTPGMTRGSGVQAKGGSADVTVRGCRFEHAGGRGVNAGGSTGLAYFRPPLSEAKPPLAEARDVRVLGNTFRGGGTAVAFVGVDGAEVRWNTVHRPARWAFRILQEARDERFVPSRGGVVAANLVVFRSDAWSEGGVNVGAGTAPDTFRFEGNAWWCEDAPQRTRALVRLPTPERNGHYGVDPKLRDAAAGDLRIGRSSALRGVGHEACPPAR